MQKNCRKPLAIGPRRVTTNNSASWNIPSYVRTRSQNGTIPYFEAFWRNNCVNSNPHLVAYPKTICLNPRDRILLKQPYSEI